VLSMLESDDVPSPEDLEVSSTGYLLGLGDSVGELRRFCLDELKAGRTERANHFLERMEDIFVALMRFDLPDAIVPIRRKQDVARSLLEKTRGDVAVATSARNLQDRLEEVLRKS
jgi:translin